MAPSSESSHPASSQPGSLALDMVLQPALLPADIWNDGDDWKGVTNSAERKKRQNRINQRAYRRRKAIFRGQAISSSPLKTAVEHDGPALISCPRRKARAQSLMRQAYEDYSLGRAQGTNLHIVVRLNVLDALARNAVVMGFAAEGLCNDIFVSPYCQQGPPHVSMTLAHGTWPLAKAIPENLLSTNVQQSTPHHPWIDLFPFPQFRDNMLHALAVGSIDEDELCYDMVEVDGPVPSIGSKPSIIVWGESWDMKSWEASVPFLVKWGWLLRGCDELIESTNHWRQKRGEKRLVFNTSW